MGASAGDSYLDKLEKHERALFAGFEKQFAQHPSRLNRVWRFICDAYSAENLRHMSAGAYGISLTEVWMRARRPSAR